MAFIEKWRPDRGVVAEFLDMNLLVRVGLPLPVGGLLGPSYMRAITKAGKGVATAASTAVMLTAQGTVSVP